MLLALVSSVALHFPMSPRSDFKGFLGYFQPILGQFSDELGHRERCSRSLYQIAGKRLRKLIDALIAVKCRRAADDPELFTAYGTLARDAKSVVVAQIEE